MRVKRFMIVIILGVFFVGLGSAVLVDSTFLARWKQDILQWVGSISGFGHIYAGLLLIIVGLAVILLGMRHLVHSIAESVLPRGETSLAQWVYRNRNLAKGPRIVVVGGGTGLSTMLRGLKEYSDNITAIVTVADDGGSSGRIREELGILPPGDIRNTLVSLADTEPLMERLFQYRFSWGQGLEGHSFGNLFIAAMTDITGDFEEAIREMSKVLAVRGRVLPATLATVKLGARYEDGDEAWGESHIPQEGRQISQMFLEPSDVSALPEALQAIEQADVVVLGPGSLYTSIIPNLLVHPIPEAIGRTNALRVYVCNVMTQPGETENMTAAQHVRALVAHAGRRRIVDAVLVNDEQISPEQAAKYANQGAYAIEPDLAELRRLGVQVRAAKLLDAQDLVRHDPRKLAREIMQMVEAHTDVPWWEKNVGS